MAKKSSVNKAGNYTKPGMRKRLFKSLMGRAGPGTENDPIARGP